VFLRRKDKTKLKYRVSPGPRQNQKNAAIAKWGKSICGQSSKKKKTTKKKTRHVEKVKLELALQEETQSENSSLPEQQLGHTGEKIRHHSKKR